LALEWWEQESVRGSERLWAKGLAKESALKWWEQESVRGSERLWAKRLALEWWEQESVRRSENLWAMELELWEQELASVRLLLASEKELAVMSMEETVSVARSPSQARLISQLSRPPTSPT
jgi:hypothetical protein